MSNVERLSAEPLSAQPDVAQSLMEECGRDTSSAGRLAQAQAVNHRLERLQGVTDAALESLERPDMPVAMLHAICAALECDCGAVLLVEGDALVVRATVGKVDKEPGTALPCEGPLATLMGSSQARVGQGLAEEGFITGFVPTPRLTMAMALRLRREVLGIIQVGCSRARRVVAAEMVLFELMTDRLAIALDHARLHTMAREAMRARSELLATVSHDLQNPLNAIVLCAERLHEHLADDVVGPASRALVERICRVAQRMSRQLADLVDDASVKAGCMSIHADVHDADALVNDAIELMEPLAIFRDVSLVAQIDTPGMRVRCDRDRVFQVFSNLVGNALKFSPAGATVHLRVHRDAPTRVCFAVRDEGPGIAPAQQQHIFDRFWTSSGGAARDGHSAGLGLYIARRIVEAHGGNLWVESTVGQGSTFYFALPTA